MMKRLNSTDSFKKAFMTIFKNLFFTFVVVVIASGFIRGASFELLNVAKSISFGAIAIALLAFCVSFWAVKASIKAGEVEDEGIIFKK
jgi:hypothetical protein